MPRRPLFDAHAFAERLSARMRDQRLSGRQLAAEAGVSPATVSRVLGGWPDLSHENYLRLDAWLRGEKRQEAA